jgi:hypothetical protein
MMKAALVGGECDCDQNKNDDEHHALFVRRKFDDSEEAFHRSIAQLSLLNFGTRLSSSSFLRVVILSEAKNLGSIFCTALTKPIARDVSLRST